MCQELKEAGLPGHRQPRRECFYTCWNEINKEGLLVPVLCRPTLSELIEECGECFIALERQEALWGVEWGAVGWLESAGCEHKEGAASPKEAVAKLYLKIRDGKTM